MKLSVSLPDDDVDFLDAYAESQGIDSRSAVVQRAVQLLRAHELAPAYEDAWREWESSGAAHEWEITATDGTT